MPDSQTINYSFTLPEIGGSSNSWGTKLNANLVALDTLLKDLADDVATLTSGAAGALPASAYTAADVRAKLLTVDGAGSGVDADTVDGLQASSFLLASAYTAADVLAKLQAVDGDGCGVDADLLDGQHGAYYTDIAGRLGFTPANKAGDTFGGNVAISGSLTVTGDVTSSSDIRKKSHIQPLDGEEMLIALGRIRGFRFRMGDADRVGVIAQDVKASGLTELVAEDDRGMLSVNYAGLVAPLIAALLHLADRVRTLEARHDAP